MNIKNYDSNNKLDFADMQPMPEEEKMLILEKVEEDCKSNLHDVEIEFDDYLEWCKKLTLFVLALFYYF